MSAGDPPIFNPISAVTVTAAGNGYTYTMPNTLTTATTTGYATTTTIPYGGYSVGYSGTAYPPDMQVSGKVKAKDFEIDGISLKDTLKSIQDRLAILDTPSPEKLERFAALKKCYEEYKLLEALIGDGDNLTKKNEE